MSIETMAPTKQSDNSSPRKACRSVTDLPPCYRHC